jgi:hypothetical protein
MATSHRPMVWIAGAALAIAMVFAVLPPIAQDPGYHAFADGRTLDGIANFWNVVSNAPFLFVALWGVRAFRSHTAFVERWERVAYGVMLAGTAAVGVGSGYYHLHPSDSRLFWDRLPMTVVFLSLVAATTGERVNMRAGRLMLLPLILLGAGSVWYWRVSGDLRLYGVVQYGSMLAVPFLLIRFPARYSGAGRTWGMVALYVAAKLPELLDRQIATVVATGGHPWKHVAAAGAVFLYTSAVAGRSPLLVVPQGDQGIHTHGPEGRNGAGEQASQHQNGGHSGIGDGVGMLHLK